MKALKITLCVLLALVLLTAVVELFYYPRYRLKREAYDITKTADPAAVTVVSANVRCFSPTDVFKKSWFYRAPLLVQTLQSAAPDIIGFQEVTWLHYRYLQETLKGYDNVILYRDNSPFSEACPIFYNTAKFDLVDKGGFWLSETPDEMSKGWNAACYRVCSYVVLSQKSDGKRFAVFNTHLDHVSEDARQGGIRLVLEKIKQFGALPGILMGDLNAEENTPTYRFATEVFDDAKYLTADTDRGATYQNWGQSLTDENIDYFMVSKGAFNVLRYRVLRTTYDGVYPSDHFPILLQVTLQ